MADNKKASRQFTDEELQDLVASSDSGARAPRNRAVLLLISGMALVWSLFQLWIAEPQFWLALYIPGLSILGADQTRPLHLTFAIVLAFLAYPAFKSSPRDRIPLADWIMAILAGATAFYVYWFAREISMIARSGRLIQWPVDWNILGWQIDSIYPQVIVGALGLVLLLEASRRALG